jgi:hypothetical protein
MSDNNDDDNSSRSMFNLPTDSAEGDIKPVFKLPRHFVDPKQSVEKLNELQFNPIVKMVELHEFIEGELQRMLFSTNVDGTPKKYSQIAFTSLLATQQKIANDLLRYGYARVTESVDVNNNNLNAMPIQITLTGSDNFSLESGGTIDAE